MTSSGTARLPGGLCTSENVPGRFEPVSALGAGAGADKIVHEAARALDMMRFLPRGVCVHLDAASALRVW